MTPDQRARFYDKFYRAHETNTAISGMGMGMTIVKHLVKAQSGHVHVTSLLGQGTIINCRLPLVSETDKE